MQCSTCCTIDGDTAVFEASCKGDDSVIPSAGEANQQDKSRTVELKPAFVSVLELKKDDYPGFVMDVSVCPWLRFSKIENYGPVAEYNGSVTKDVQIHVGDFVMAVNAVKGDGREMMMALAGGGEVALCVRRARTI